MKSKNHQSLQSDKPRSIASITSRFFRFQVVVIELILLGYALHFLQKQNASAQTLLATVLFFIAIFTLITGKGFPHFRHRGKALLIVLMSGFFAISGAVVFDQEREAHLAELRKTDPAAYLTALHEIDEDRWFAALEEIDPKAYAQEKKRRASEVETQRQTACAEMSVGMAYVMIQADVKNQLRAPSTAKFPGRYETGTGYLGDCVFQVVGSFDAQNGFGAMIRGEFHGTIEYYPETQSWRTQALKVQG